MRIIIPDILVVQLNIIVHNQQSTKVEKIMFSFVTIIYAQFAFRCLSNWFGCEDSDSENEDVIFFRTILVFLCKNESSLIEKSLKCIV